MESYSITIPVAWFSQSIIDIFKDNMNSVIEKICNDWDGVDYINTGRDRRILFRESGVDFRPPMYICKDFDIIFQNSLDSDKYINTKDVKLLASKLYSEFYELQGFGFDLFITMKYDR